MFKFVRRIPTHLLKQLFGAEKPLTLSISNLPPELIVHILKGLSWRDVLSMRCVCRALYRASKAEDLWRTILAQYLSTARPKPHLLLQDPRKLSTDELEGVLGRLDLDWDVSSFSSMRTMDVPYERPGTVSSVYYLPGGYWNLEAHNDGSVWYRDLRPGQTVTAKEVLLSAPFDDTELHPGYEVTTSFSVDLPQTFFESNSAGSASIHLSPPFTHFNLAVFVSNAPSCSPKPRCIVEVWRIDIQKEGDKLVASKRLASFREDFRAAIRCCSLFGSSLAYYMGTRARSGDIFVVDWTSISEEVAQEMSYRRVVITGGQSAQLLWLLPNARLLVARVTARLELWDLSNCPTTNTVPTQLRHDEIQCSPARLWSYELQATIPIRRYPHLWYLPRSTRLVLPSSAGLVGLIIYQENQAPQREVSGDHWVDIVTLLKPNPDLGKGTDIAYSSQSFGYRRGAFYDRHGVFKLVRYSWPDDTFDMKVGTDCVLVVPSGVEHIREMYLDELAGRFVFTGPGFKKYWIVHF